MKKCKPTLFAFYIAAPLLSLGQQDKSPSFLDQYQMEILLGLTIVVAVVLIIAMFTLVIAMKTILKSQQPAEEKVAVQEKETANKTEFWNTIWNKVNASVPVAKEAAIATDHEYDGIKELDNRLPPWWLYGFYASIVFGVIYLFNFYFLDMPTQQEEFISEMEQAKADVQVYLASLDNLIDENNVVLTTSTLDLDAGKAIFEQNCVVCHAADGGGGVGPNLTDQYWLHGGDMSGIFKTVKYGVPAKGMIAWETQLSPKKMQQVSSYIYMMEGTTPVNPKEPQGEFFERSNTTNEAAVEEDSSEKELSLHESK
ncbi:MAG: cbb3-type cytochrome c oxidase N-terminal domain-containing protein [Bacteroidota bacterium]